VFPPARRATLVERRASASVPLPMFPADMFVNAGMLPLKVPLKTGP
jgi:hypothetical protein